MNIPADSQSGYFLQKHCNNGRCLLGFPRRSGRKRLTFSGDAPTTEFTDVTRTGKSAEVVTLSAKDWLTLVGILMPVVVLVIFGWIRHDRLLTEVVANQIMLKDRLERVETNLDGIRP